MYIVGLAPPRRSAGFQSERAVTRATRSPVHAPRLDLAVCRTLLSVFSFMVDREVACCVITRTAMAIFRRKIISSHGLPPKRTSRPACIGRAVGALSQHT